jgi:hypothetical protein
MIVPTASLMVSERRPRTSFPDNFRIADNPRAISDGDYDEHIIWTYRAFYGGVGSRSSVLLREMGH